MPAGEKGLRDLEKKGNSVILNLISAKVAFTFI
jgi:hypothetical protein